jgi:hypothetical protein
MNMEKAIIAQELSISDLAAEGLHRYVRNFKAILLIFICTVLPANLLSTLIGGAWSLLGKINPSALEESNTISLMLCSGFGTVSLLTGILIGVVQLWATIAVARVVEDDILDRHTDWKAALRQTYHRLWSVIGTSILMGFFLMLLSLCLILPGFIYSIYWVFTPYVAALRGMGGQQAMDYSKSLVSGRWWLAFSTFIIFSLLVLLFLLPVMLLTTIISLIPFVGFLTNTVIQIAAALLTVLMVVFFLNIDYCRSGVPAAGNLQPSTATSRAAETSNLTADAPELPRFRLPDPPE